MESKNKSMLIVGLMLVAILVVSGCTTQDISKEPECHYEVEYGKWSTWTEEPNTTLKTGTMYNVELFGGHWRYQEYVRREMVCE